MAIIFSKGETFCRLENDYLSGERKGNIDRVMGKKRELSAIYFLLW